VTYASTVLAESSILSYWALDESAGTSGAGSVLDTAPTSPVNGTPTSVTFGSAGLILAEAGTSATFNGSSGGISMGNASSLQFSGTASFSVEAWVNVTNVTNQQSIVGKWSNGLGSTNGWCICIASGQAFIQRWAAGVPQTATSTVGLSINTTYHLVGTFDGTSVRIYVNAGAPITTGSPVSINASDTSNFGIGAFDGGTFYYTGGRIGNVAVYNAVLNATQISAHYVAGTQIAGAPTFVAVGAPAFTASNGATFAPGLPAGWAADDIHVLLIARGDNTAATSITNYTNIATLTGNNTIALRVEVWWRRAVAGDTAPTVTFGSSTVVRGGVIYGVRGCLTGASPFDTSSLLANAASATVTFTNVSSTVDNCLVLAMLAYEDDPTTLSTMGTFIQPASNVSGSTLGNDLMLGVEQKQVSTAGTVGASTLTVSGGTFANSVNSGIILVLKPPVGGGGGVVRRRLLLHVGV
jgi:hypothetical protein